MCAAPKPYRLLAAAVEGRYIALQYGATEGMDAEGMDAEGMDAEGMDGSMDEIQGYAIEDLSVGMTAASAKTVTDADMVLFAGVSGDLNPLHHNQEFAETTVFGGRIAPGLLTASLISAVFGNKLPGAGCIYLSQNLRFRAPVRVGDTVLARVTVTEVMAEKGRVAFSTQCSVGETVVLDGEALMLVPSRQQEGAAAPPAAA